MNLNAQCLATSSSTCIYYDIFLLCTLSGKKPLKIIILQILFGMDESSEDSSVWYLKHRLCAMGHY